MHKAGDFVTVLEGPYKGRVLPIRSVRMFATDSGYYLVDGAGLYSPKMVALARERTSGNPCGEPCDARDHHAIKMCDHCRGVCLCYIPAQEECP